MTADVTTPGINALLVPAISGTMRLNNGAAYANTTSVTIDSAVTGATQMHFRDSGGTWSSWESYAASRSWTLPAGDGTKTVEAEYRDAVGRVLGVSDDIFLDTSAPTTTASGADANWHNSAVTLTLSASDNVGGSGLDKTYYTIDGTQHTYSAPFAVSAQGSHAVTYWSVDKAGNTEIAKTCTVKIDTTGPVASAKAAKGKVGHALKLSYRITDNLSPQATSVKLVVKNSAGKVVKTLACGTQSVAVWHTVAWTPKSKGTYRYWVYAKDLAGNSQSKIGTAKITVK